MILESSADEFSSDRSLPLILAVDDDDDNLVLLTQIVAPLDCALITATNGRMTIELARQHRPDLILLDIGLPEMDGFMVMRVLKQDDRTRNIPILVITAMANPEDEAKVLEEGCDAYLSKPYDLEVLEALILQHLR